MAIIPCQLIQDKSPIQLANFLIDNFKKRVPNDIQNFKTYGFTKETLSTDLNNLFKFTILVGYDRTPFHPYEIVWDSNNPRSVSSVLNASGLFDVSKIQTMPENNLDGLLQKLVIEKQLHLHSTTNSKRGGVRFAKMITELAQQVSTLKNKLLSVNNEMDVIYLHQFMDSIHGFGKTLPSKLILYLLREIKIKDIDPSLLAYAADGLKDEMHNKSWCKKAISLKGQIYFNEVFCHLKSDPLAFDFIFYLDREYCKKRRRCQDCNAL